jgi:hypothetical protein
MEPEPQAGCSEIISIKITAEKFPQPYMDIRSSIFDFLFIQHLTQVGDFSPLVDSGASVDHYNVLKLFSCYHPHSRI